MTVVDQGKGNSMKVAFLHGIGDGDPDRGWMDGLNRGLLSIGHPPIDESQVIAPRYAGLLETNGVSAKMPDITYKPKDDPRPRCEFERRQAAIYRMLRDEPTSTGVTPSRSASWRRWLAVSSEEYPLRSRRLGGLPVLARF